MEELPIPGARERAELKLRREQMKRYPFCPDHRDKVWGDPCKQCEIVTMRRLLQAAYHLLMAAQGPDEGPTNWVETRQRWIDASAEFRKGK